MTVPEWVQDAIFYQIFPDRFANGNRENDPPGTVPWGTPPAVVQFQGGDLEGVIQRLGYLSDLGINAIYFTPIFESVSNHRYDAVDYLLIDRKLGKLNDFHRLIQLAHQQGIKVILDGVFNHCGRSFYAFRDLVENGEQSGYRDWFHVRRFPLNAYTPGKAVNYEAWWGYKSLPKFNTDNPGVRKMIFDVARYWVDQGADGWRLDVPNEIDDDEFWGEFRKVVKAANPQAYILGEIWEALPRWVGDNMFDGVMNYPVRTAVLNWLDGKSTSSAFVDAVEKLLKVYPMENVRAMYVPLGSHDTERLATVLNENIQRVKLALTFQFTYPGAPAVYYGDEIGLTGGKDPECRKAFPWDEQEWNQDLRQYLQKLIHIRKTSPALRRGTLQRSWVSDADRVVVFQRNHEDGNLVVALNNDEQAHPVRITNPCKDGGTLQGLMSGQIITIEASSPEVEFILPPMSGEIFTLK